jgi:cytochrome c oxidase subunit 2
MNELLRRILFLPEQASSFAPGLDALHYSIILTSMVVATLIGLVALFFYVRFRQRSPTQSTPVVTPRWFHEVAFIGVPLAIFLLWFFIGFPKYVEMQSPPPDAVQVFVEAKKWMWKFAYPGGPSGLDALHVPVNRPVRLLMTSRDVIHSFYVPSFRIKQDVLPGRYTQTWFKATQVGKFQVLCAEMCGVGHSAMLAEVVVMPQAEFDAWLADQRRGIPQAQDSAPVAADAPNAAGSLLAQGKAASERYECFKCHTTDGTQHIGPTWLDLYRKQERLSDGRTVVADEGYLTESMMDPNAKLVAGYQAVMPTYQGKMSPPEVAAVLEYIKSLRTDAVSAGPSKGPSYGPIPSK